MPASAVRSPVAVTRTRRLPDPLSVPAITGAPCALVTGWDSPVIIASFTSDSPSCTTPSAGTLPPGRTSTTSPSRSAETAISSVAPSGSSLSAVSGRRRASSSRAPEAWRTLRISTQCPRSMMSTRVTNSQKKGSMPGRNRDTTL